MIEVTFVEGKKRRKLRVKEILGKDLSAYKLIGTAEGHDQNHCLYLAIKYADNFEERVAGYQPAKTKRKGNIALKFFEKKKKAKP